MHHAFQATMPIASDKHQGITKSIQTGFQQQRAVQHDQATVRILLIMGQQSGSLTADPRMEKRFQLAALRVGPEDPIGHRFPVNQAGIFENLLSPPAYQCIDYLGLGQLVSIEAIRIDLRRAMLDEQPGDCGLASPDPSQETHDQLVLVAAYDSSGPFAQG